MYLWWTCHLSHRRRNQQYKKKCLGFIEDLWYQRVLLYYLLLGIGPYMQDQIIKDQRPPKPSLPPPPPTFNPLIYSAPPCAAPELECLKYFDFDSSKTASKTLWSDRAWRKVKKNTPLGRRYCLIAHIDSPTEQIELEQRRSLKYH